MNGKVKTTRTRAYTRINILTFTLLFLKENVFQLFIADLMEKHEGTCEKEKTETCKTCRIPWREMENWDSTMRGGALEREFGTANADAIIEKLEWQKWAIPPKPPSATTARRSKAVELIEQSRKRKIQELSVDV